MDTNRPAISASKVAVLRSFLDVDFAVLGEVHVWINALGWTVLSNYGRDSTCLPVRQSGSGVDYTLPIRQRFADFEIIKWLKLIDWQICARVTGVRVHHEVDFHSKRDLVRDSVDVHRRECLLVADAASAPLRRAGNGFLSDLNANLEGEAIHTWSHARVGSRQNDVIEVVVSVLLLISRKKAHRRRNGIGKHATDCI